MKIFKFNFDRTLLALFLIFLLGVLPLILDPWVEDRTLTPRLLALYLFLGAVWLFTLLPQVRVSLAWNALKSPLVYSYAAYLISVWASLFVALNISAGFMDAFKTSAAFLVLCSAAVFFASMDSWPHVLAKVSVIAAMVSGGVGHHQIRIHFLGELWSSREAMSCIDGRMSNVNLYASYLMLLLPLCFLGVAILKSWWRWISLLCVGNTAFLLLVLQTRAAWLGVGAAVLFAAAMICWRPDSLGISKTKRNIIAVLIAFSVLAVASFIAWGARQNPFVSRFWDTFSCNVTADGGRLVIWQATLRMIADYFPFGVGAGNFTIRLHDYKIGGDYGFQGGGLEWIQPHNDYLWVFAEKGALGGVAFLAIFFFAIHCCLRVLRRGGTPVYAWTAVLCFSSVLAYMVNSFFDFPLYRVNHQVCLAILLAALVGADRRYFGSEAGAERVWPFFQKRGYLILAGPLLLLLLASGVAYSFAAMRQERHVKLARVALDQGDWDTLAAQARLAATSWRTLDPYAVPISFLEGMAYMRQGKNDAAIACFEKARLENPNRFYIVNNLGVLYAQRGDYQRAIQFLSFAAERYPMRFEILNNLAACYNQIGAHKKALSVLKKIPSWAVTLTIRENIAIASDSLVESKVAALIPVNPVNGSSTDLSK